jgi:hypothetical protein
MITGEFSDLGRQKPSDAQFVSTASEGDLRLGSTEVLSGSEPAPATDSVTAPGRSAGELDPTVADSDSRVDTVPQEEVVEKASDESGDAPRVAQGDVLPVDDETLKALPHQLLRSIRQDNGALTSPGEMAGSNSESNASLARLLANSESVPRDCDLTLSSVMKASDSSGQPTERTDLYFFDKKEEPAQRSGPTDKAPKANIVDKDHSTGGSQQGRRPEGPAFEERSWRPASDSAPVHFLARAEVTGDSAVVAAVIPRETTHLPTPDGPNRESEDESTESGPSIAQVRAAWQAGMDIPLGPASDSSGHHIDTQSPDGWDPWLDSELPGADFPSRDAVNESPEAAPSDAQEGTQLEVPVTSRLMAQLDAQRRHREGEAESAQPAPDKQASRTTPPRDTDSNAPLFGAPIGARPALKSSTSVQAKAEVSEPKPDPPEVRRQEPTEVPMAAMNFTRPKKKPRGED